MQRTLTVFGPVLLVLGMILTLPSASWGIVLYSENFEVDPSANWTVNNGLSDESHNFFFDYSTVGIPSAPNAGGATRGMKLQANLSNGIFSGMSASPNGQSFTGNYTVTFDWWANFNGPFPAGGSGSTNLSTFGIGTVGNTPQWPGGAQDSVWFAATGDGGSAADWRAYSTAAPTSYPDGDPVYESALRNASDPYYAGFGNVAAPAAQLALFPQQTGNTVVGAAGMDWHEVAIAKNGDEVTWTVDGLLIATIDLTTVTLSGSNIFFGHSDINATSSTDLNDAALLFSLIDNIQVQTNRVVPEPATVSLLLMGCLLLGRRKARGRSHREGHYAAGADRVGPRTRTGGRSMLKLKLLAVLLAIALPSLMAAPVDAALIHYTAFLDGPSESPPVPSPGTGTALVRYDSVAVTLRVEAAFADLIGATTVAHIHGPTAVPGEGTAGVMTVTPTFVGFPIGVTSGTYLHTYDLTDPASFNPTFVTANGGTAAGATAALLASLDAGSAYFNIHTSFAGGGEIRGFLARVVPEPASAALLTLILAPAVLLRRRH